MKKVLALLLTGTVVFAACNKADMTSDESANMAPITHRQCASYEVLQEQIAADPALRQRMEEIERFTQQYTANPNRLLTDGTMEIPVVVNVLYRTAAENITDAQIASQIAVLNEDYGGTNSDINKVPSEFSGVKAGAVKVKFVLNKIVRKQTNKTSWGTNDAMKKSKQGGIDPTSPTTMLNMWACTLGQGLLGYAQFPGGNPATDGVVILNSAFGSRAKYPSGYYISTYDLGRTATHEVGHWLNLRHIWGDATCGSDFVDDTPPHQSANYNCPGTLNLRCTSNSTTNPYGFTHEMTMNYMDYTADACMYMFSLGQRTRMEAVFAANGPRASFR